MATPPIDPDLLQQAVDAVAQHGTITKAAKALGIPRGTLDKRINKAKEQNLKPATAARPNLFEQPALPSADLKVTDLWERMEQDFKRRFDAHNARKWHTIKVKSNQPIGICHFGDPHLDSNGCNVPQLRADIQTVASTEGMSAGNLGDSHDNWTDRLLKIYANAGVTRSQGVQLIEDFFMHRGIEWLYLLTGNHDAWNFGSDLLKAITRNLIPLFDWQAQVQLEFPNSKKLRIWAAHDFKWKSDWNNTHGPMKMARISGVADLYICGHKHEYGIYHGEDPFRGSLFWAARARGYKVIDQYAEQGNFGSGAHGHSIVSIINPGATREDGFLQCYGNVQEAAEYLTYLRGRAQ